MNMFRILMLACLVAAIPILATAQVTTVKCMVASSCTTNSLQTASLGGAQTVIVQGYYAPGDGGGGEFYLHNAGSCALPGEDGGTVIHNTAGCYYRRFTGTVYMSWFGVQDSTGAGLNDVATACSSFAQPHCWANAFAAAATPSGNNNVSTGGMYLYSTEDVTPQADQTLTCDSSYTGQATSNYAPSGGINGVILLGPKSDHSGHSASIHLLYDNDEFHRCVVLTNGSANAINLNPGNCGTGSGEPKDAAVQRCLLTDLQNMALNGDVGVYCEGSESAFIHAVTVIGFDTGIGTHGCSRFRLQNAQLDDDVGIYLQNNKSPALIDNIKVNPFLGSGLSNSQTTKSYEVSSIGDAGDGTHRCAITVTAASSRIMTGDWVSLAGDKTPFDEGQLSCYGTLQAYVPGASNVVILQNTKYGDSSVFSTVAVGNSWLQSSSVINVGDVTGIQAGQCIKSSDGAFTGYSCPIIGGSISDAVKVKDVSYYSHKIVIDRPTQSVQAPGSTATLTFYNPGVYPHTTGQVSTLYLYASTRIVAGDSVGGAASGKTAACIWGGGPGDTSPLGLIANNMYCFGHRMQYIFNSVGPAICTGCGFDSQAELFDIQQTGVRYGHGTDPLVLAGVLPATSGSSCAGTSCLGSITFDSTLFNPNFAGWRVGDTIVGTNRVQPNSIASIDPITDPATGAPAFNLTLNAAITSGATGTEPIYDVKPLNPTTTPVVPTGKATSGSPTITLLSADPNTNWKVGDRIFTPQTTDFPFPGATIVSMSAPGCTPSVTCSITLSANAASTHPSPIIGDLSVTTPQSTASADFVGSNLGGGGGFVLDAGGFGCNSIQGVTIQVNNAGQPALESDSGCTLATNVSTNQQNDVMVDASTGSFQLTSSQFGRAGVYFEGPAVSRAFSGTGNLVGASGSVGSGGASNMTTFGDTSKCPTTSQSSPVVFCGGADDGLTGNAYQSCNPGYVVSASVACMTTSLDENGKYQQSSAARSLPFFEYNDQTLALLPQTYEDGIQATSILGSIKTVSSAVTVVSSCAHASCALDGVSLPSSSAWIDAGAQASNTDCPGVSGRNCGVAGAITIINASPSVGPNSGTITVWCGSGDKLNGASCSGTSATIGANQSMTFRPILTRSGGIAGGWYTN
jgi:hypothetical protein